jgi:hypothetical protein
MSVAAFVLTKPLETLPEVPAPAAADPPAVRVCAPFEVAATCPLGLPVAPPEAQVGVDVPEVPTWVGCAL